jgi:hypothetical protein
MRLLPSLAALSLLVSQTAQAQLTCLPPQDRSAIEVAALRSELMVLATGCQADEKYNAFVRKYQPDLMGNEKAVDEMFKRKYGRRGQQEHDRFTTDLANVESSTGNHRYGSDFCAHNGMLFTEVMALRDGNELAAYAAGKDLVPESLEVCTEVAIAPAPERKQVATKKH